MTVRGLWSNDIFHSNSSKGIYLERFFEGKLPTIGKLRINQVILKSTIQITKSSTSRALLPLLLDSIEVIYPNIQAILLGLFPIYY